MGIGNLISAMPSILKNHPNTLCVIGGSGALADDLKAQAAKLGLHDRVRFAGFIAESDLPAYYAAADLFVLPTTALEGFGMVTVEALACGTPVLGTPIGATPEILQNLDGDLLLEGVEPEDIARGAVAMMSRSVAERANLRAKCRNYAVSNYSWALVSTATERVLREAATCRTIN
jgi:glycosyltransferase involved in cell wall biosynthesis